MTTIAVKDGVMACDSCWLDDNEVHSTSLTKITRLKSGALLGEAGDVDSRAMVRLLQNVKTFEQVPLSADLAATNLADYAGLLLFPSGKVAMLSVSRSSTTGGCSAGAHEVNRGGAAVGSGAGIAVGAMDSGKSAREAVEIACRRDPYSKAPVHAMSCVSSRAMKKKG